MSMRNNITDFKIVEGKLISYTGKAEKLLLPYHVTKIGKEAFLFWRVLSK